ncbi:hypothetical protein chiPu_0005856 [Chiloscyllium punctatum]|uniref:Uncharacterized protein n=1 Tax=Chiloscyllium punctatum TaxID=137246 RepID=A0A401SAL5_CHIPU|nr:hypothetical protein [Chiloscyllium punctatum]
MHACVTGLKTFRIRRGVHAERAMERGGGWGLWAVLAMEGNENGRESASAAVNARTIGSRSCILDIPLERSRGLQRRRVRHTHTHTHTESVSSS